MKKSHIITLAAILISLVYGMWASDYYSFDNRMNRTLNRFANPRANYRVLLDGIATDGVDTVQFHLIPAVSWAINQAEYEHVNSSTCEYSRDIWNQYRIPCPEMIGEKLMYPWVISAKRALTQNEQEKCLATLQRVFRKGWVEYSAFSGIHGTDLQGKLFESFVGSHLSDSKASELMNKAVNPFFE